MNYKAFLISLCIYLLFLCSAVLIVMSGVSYGRFSSDLLIYSSKIKYHIVFGIGIGVSFIVFFGLIVLLFFPKLKYNFFVTFPLLLIIPASYIYLSYPNSADRFLSNWDNDWKVSIESEGLQVKQRCCGWNNLTDRALDPCPELFVSGCRKIVYNYLDSRFTELFYCSCIILGVSSIGLIAMGFICYQASDQNIFSQIVTV